MAASQEILDQGPQLNELAVEEFEKSIGAKLPATYRAFLLQHNGGRPSRPVFEVPAHPERDFEVHYFHGLGRASPTSNLDWWRTELPPDATAGVVDIAGTDTGDRLLLDYADGSVQFLDSLAGDGERRRYRIASSFTEFFAGLYADDTP